MYNSLGEKTWEAEYDMYGKVRKLAKGSLTDCPFRYQGQYADVETGLYYNRFRYYSADEGIYLSQDPIGLEGNNRNLYSYTHDVNSLVDIFGLSECLGPNVPEYHKNNFKGKIKNRQVDGDEIFYKYHGKHNRLGKTHNYVTKKQYSSEANL